jgi:hypothetical protein
MAWPYKYQKNPEKECFTDEFMLKNKWVFRHPWMVSSMQDICNFIDIAERNQDTHFMQCWNQEASAAENEFSSAEILFAREIAFSSRCLK